MNIVKQIQRDNAGRDPELLALKYQRLRQDPFVFLRGTCHLFYARLALEASMRKAPATWASGDLHLENFGSYKADTRQVYFDINDFDQALLAPATWDLVRCLASILVGRRSLGLNRRHAAVPGQLCEVLLDAYAQALAEGKARWVERDTAATPVRELLQGLGERSRPDFLGSRTVLKGRRRQIRTDGAKALPATADQRKQVMTFFAGFAAHQPAPRFFEVLDVARRVAGSGSLGISRYVVLVRGKGSPDGNYLLDLKRVLPSPVHALVPQRQPMWADEATRAVAVEQRMQAIAVALLNPVRVAGEPYVLRELQPSEDRVALFHTHHPVNRLKSLVTVMGQLVAWAQLRSSGRDGSASADELIDFAAQRKWQRRVLQLAGHGAAQVQADWKVFASAYDDGVFGTAGRGSASARR